MSLIRKCPICNKLLGRPIHGKCAEELARRAKLKTRTRHNIEKSMSDDEVMLNRARRNGAHLGNRKWED